MKIDQLQKEIRTLKRANNALVNQEGPVIQKSFKQIGKISEFKLFSEEDETSPIGREFKPNLDFMFDEDTEKSNEREISGFMTRNSKLTDK